MNYEKLISENVAELEVLEKQQRFVRNEKRVQFLKFLKSGEDKPRPFKNNLCQKPLYLLRHGADGFEFFGFLEIFVRRFFMARRG